MDLIFFFFELVSPESIWRPPRRRSRHRESASPSYVL